ncbi:MAG: restriction endonuclease subunit S [Bacteroidales bacterium]
MVKDIKIADGYKQTEVGVIPVDWKVELLSKISHFENGKAHEQFIDEHGDFIVVNSKFISTEGKVKKYSKKKIFPLKKGDITVVMSDIPNGKALAKCFLIDKSNKYTLNQRIGGITANEDNDNKYLFYKLNRNKFYLSFDSGTGQTNIKRQEILDCPIPLPPTRAEQTAIATALSDMDALIEGLEKLLVKKRNIKQGAMQDLLKPKDGWEIKMLGEALTYEQPTKYLVLNTEYNPNSGIPVLTAGKSFILGYTNEEFGVFSKVPVIIFDDFTTSIQFVKFKFKVKSSALKILKKRSNKFNLVFLYSLMQLIKFDATDHKRYWISEYQNIKIKVPDSIEQTRIAQILSDMDTEISQLETELSKYKMLKTGMMQELLTGKKRLI